MRFFTSLAVVAFVASVCAVPITPSAPELQRRAEQFRLQGLREHEIAEQLTLTTTTTTSADSSLPIISRLSTKLHALFHDCTSDDHDDDVSGDIPPGSLEAPQMLPRPTPISSSALERLVAFLKKTDDEAFAYEGKELELRRPTGMRHWGAADKWRLF
ncbi:hypothetical protein BU23DRAFT_584943 [Bimuria novae-zelandiae CBS 107.79]|uniref:Uncharacterized protein n=1 Tax=Bimuria novae-zelandiae CBS 107.79 TaxID=1447943 RepID=A0A6A5UMI3_9PLEO|nr:hypothetical protein BU23DRAFT_584943 [Bimuria novae-zelandiae CBS 107.79]